MIKILAEINLLVNLTIFYTTHHTGIQGSQQLFTLTTHAPTVKMPLNAFTAVLYPKHAYSQAKKIDKTKCIKHNINTK